jgi:sporulation protein YlmC with PRC-barrel domain
MKRKFQFIIIFAASIQAVLAQSQDVFNPKMYEANYIRNDMSRPQRPDQLNNTAKASDLIGMAVNNYQHEKLGNVKDFTLDVESGRIVQVILSTGEFIPIGTMLTAVPPEALHYDVDHKVLRLDATKEKLNATSRFDSSNWNEEMQSNRVAEVYGQYGEHPYFVADRDGYWTNKLDGTLTTKYPLNMDGTINTDGARTADRSHNVAEDAGAILMRIPDGTWTEGHSWKESATNSWCSGLGYVEKASGFIGTPVKNLQAEKLGKVENFMVDLSSGRIVAVIISSGGYIGIGVELRAVPPTALKFNAKHDTLQLDASNEILASSPYFKANQ